VPIAPARFKVTFTASAELEGKIGRARALLRHQIPSGDLAEIVDRAMTLLLAELDRKRCAATERPRKSVADADTRPSSRHVPAPVRRTVWQRDGGRCAFVDADGRRCSATARLEVHHVVPFGRGGDHSVENLRLMCQSHNSYQAEVDYGRTFIEARRRSEESKPDTDGGPPRAT
jgi:5-methylcytosine-specific restriction endonuclease McrA